MIPYRTTHRAAGTCSADTTTETYDLDTRGRRALILATNLEAIGVGHSFVQGAAITLPLVVVAATNDTFKFNSVEYTMAPGSYTTLTQVKNAVAAAVHTATAFSTVVTPSVSGTGLKFTNVASGVHAEAFAVGTTDVLVSLGITAGWTIAHTEAAGGDGTASMTVSVLGVLPLSGATYTILAGAAITSVGAQVLQVSPCMVGVTNAVANAELPATVRISITHTTDDAVTYSVESQLIS